MPAPDRHTLGYDVRYDVMNETPQTLNDAQRLLAELTHDVRQPLTTIKMNLQAIVRLLGQSPPSQQIAAALDAIGDCLLAERELDALFTGVGQLVARESRSLPRIELNDVAVDGVRLYRLISRMCKGIELRLAEPSPVVNGDARRIRYALQTLLRHALGADKESPPGEQVVVGTRRAGSYAELSVGGLPLPVVFGPTHSSALTVTNLVARAYGGIARIESSDSCATVRIVFPEARRSSS
jgi:signal transduction histidine kinase